MTSLNSSMLPFLLCLLFSLSWATSAHSHEDFLQCLFHYSDDSAAISKVVYTPQNSSYSSVLQFSIQNLRFNSTRLKPRVIVTPTKASHIQAAIHCSQKHYVQIRVRSGGHDFEGLSYRSVLPFVIVDLINLRNITVDEISKTAWVQAGATLGELYYSIAEKSKTLGFPAGSCPTIGVGGHFSGGGYSTMSRKFGLAADNVIDAQLIDVKGRILDRSSMGEDLFWAIRGGGGHSFGLVIAWKIRLVEVPPTVTTFTIIRSLEQNATKLIHKWQSVANQLPQEITIDVFITRVNSSQSAKQTIRTVFYALFLGDIERLLPLMQERFPELGLAKENCTEMSWVEAIVEIAGFPSNSSLDVLLNRTQTQSKFKAKSDYVKEPIPEIAWDGIWERFFEEDIEAPRLILVPYGGKMNEISESSIPFPHRAGNLYIFVPVVSWSEEGKEAEERQIGWTRRLYRYITPYVSNNPREAYVNYRDLDLGTNKIGNTSYEQASIWGKKYFKNNFDRLVHVKTEVDPTNFFRNEQSIPPLSSWRM